MQKDKFTPIHNEVLEALAKVNLSPYETRILFVIWRKTFGFADENGNRKKLDYIALSQFTDMTGLDRRHVSRALTSLKKKKLIVKERMRIGFSKEFISVIGIDDIVMSPVEMTVSPVEMTTVTSRDDNLSSVEAHTKEKKETITKEIYIEVLNYWNNKNIIIHAISENIKTQIRVALRKYKKAEIFLAMDHYTTMLNDTDCKTVSYKWSLEIFLKQGNCLPYFLDDGVRWINYEIPSQISEMDKYEDL